ncbi:MAG: hypothetical protein ACOCZR_03340 [Halanaerobiales bacterium]
MLTTIYWLITLFVFLLVLWNYFEKDEWDEQVNAVLIIIPLILRILMLK